jgi:hypothetical protein
MKESVFIETTIPSYYVARRSRDIVQAARQELTIQWWEERRNHYSLFSSAIVVSEAAMGDPDTSAARLKLLADIPLLPITPRVLKVAKELLAAQIVPAKASDDAFHIACAGVHAWTSCSRGIAPILRTRTIGDRLQNASLDRTYPCP